MNHFAALLALAFTTLPLAGQSTGTRPGPQGGPWFHEIHSASSRDGLAWTRDAGIRLEHASVPCAVVSKGTIFLYFVDAGAGPEKVESASVATSTDGMTFTKQPLDIAGMTTRKSLDPSMVLDGDGKFWLYYYGCNANPEAQGAHEIHVASSDDGVRFRERGCVYQRAALVDPDVFFFKDTWYMFVFGREGTEVATSSDGFDFAYQKPLSIQGWGTVAPVRLDRDTLRLYAFDQRQHSGNTIASFLSSDGWTWKREEGVRLRAADGEQITDPFVVRWKDGWKMFFKSDKTRPREPRQLASRPAPTLDEFLPPSFPGPAPAVAAPPQTADRPGPWDNDVWVYRVNAAGKAEPVITFERAGVPTMARLQDGRLIAAYQHFPKDDQRNFDRVAVRFSADDGKTWNAPQPIVVEGMSDSLARPFDPTLVPLPDGRVRLYFTSNDRSNPRFAMSPPAIYSAVSKDGIHYQFEDGVRFAIAGRITIDCAAALHEGVFHLFVPDNGTAREMEEKQQRHEPPRQERGYHAVSRDGLTFERVDDVAIEGNTHWLGNVQSVDGRLVFIGTGNVRGTGGGGIWMAESADGASWKAADSPVLRGADPAAVKTRDGGWIVAVTGEPREGSASARRMGRRAP